MSQTNQPIISQVTWDKFTEEEKAKLLDYYNSMSREETSKHVLEVLFDKENLESVDPKIKTWEDVEAEYPQYRRDLYSMELSYAYTAVTRKLIAIYQIVKLIDLAYGGIITDKEWKNGNIEKFQIVPNKTLDEYQVSRVYNISHKDTLSFKSRELAEEFLSYPENLELVKLYFQI